MIKNFSSNVSFNALSVCLIHTISTVVCLSRLLDTGGTGKRAFFIMFRLSLTRLSCAQRTEKRTFPLSRLLVPHGTGRRVNVHFTLVNYFI